jgi:hypothetical protein
MVHMPPLTSHVSGDRSGRGPLPASLRIDPTRKTIRTQLRQQDIPVIQFAYEKTLNTQRTQSYKASSLNMNFMAQLPTMLISCKITPAMHIQKRALMPPLCFNATLSRSINDA